MTSEISEPQSRMEIQQAPNQNDQEVQEQESRKYDAFNDKELKKLKRFHTFFEEKATDIRKQNEDILKISQEMKSERDSIGNADYTTPDVILEINAAKRSCYDGRNKCKRKAKTNATSGGDLQKEGLSSLTGHKDANEARCNARIRLNAQQMTEFCLDKEGIENMRAPRASPVMELTVLILIYLSYALDIKKNDQHLYHRLLVYITRLILQTDKVEHNWRSVLTDASEMDKSNNLSLRISHIAGTIQNVNSLDEFYNELSSIVTPMPDGCYNDNQIDPYSLYGLYIRKACATKSNLTFEGSIDLLEAFHAHVTSETSSVNLRVGQYEHQLLSWPRTEVDEIIPRRVEAFNEFQSASNKSDIHAGSESLRKFFDYRPSSVDSENIKGSGSHQHALASLAAFFITHGVIEEARRALDESITMSRISKDIETLNGCNRLIRQLDKRLACPDPHSKSLANQDFTVMDELFDIKVALDEGGETLSDLMTRSTRALIRLDEASALDKVDASIQTWAAVNATLWDTAGAKSIRDIYQTLATSGDTWHTSAQLTTRINMSNQYSQNGNYASALECLFNDKLLSEINLVEYLVWAEGVWNVLRRRAERLDKQWPGPSIARANDSAKMREIETLISKAVGKEGNRDFVLEQLLLAYKMADDRQYHSLKLKTHVELLAFETRHQHGINVLGDIDTLFARAISSDDGEVEARACEVYAERAILNNDLPLARTLLQRAEKAYERLQDTTKHCDCLYALIGVLERCGDESRDTVIDKLVQIEEATEMPHKPRDKIEEEVSSLIQHWGIVISLRA